MTEQRISFETAVLAKEKGIYLEYCSCGGYPDCICVHKRPTQSLLQKLLRDEINIIVDVISWKDHASDVNDPLEWKCFVNGRVVHIHFKSYEEALEEGLKEALKLIQKIT